MDSKEEKTYAEYVGDVFKARLYKKILQTEEKLKAWRRSLETDFKTIPVIEIPITSIKDVSLPPGSHFWARDAVDARTPVILGRNYDVICGATQFYKAFATKQEKINAVYIDSLYDKDLSLNNIKNQFENEDICKGFVYQLYLCISERDELTSFSFFAEKIYKELENWDIGCQIRQYINELDYELGD